MTLIHPYQGIDSIRPLRGNLHAHTTESDGMCPQQVVIDDYARRGYDFLMLSDHDIYTSEAQLARFDSKGIVLIPGNEVSRGGPHLLHIGEGGFVEPDAQRQTVISKIVEVGGLAVVNHPNWQGEFDHCTFEQMKEWVGYVGMEIYNGVIHRLYGNPYATMKWDKLLSMGRQVWGFANDDSHHPASDVGLGWNMVYAKDRTPAAIIEALRNGRFYASTGVIITKIEVEGDVIRVQTQNAQRINAISHAGRRLAFADSDRIEVTVPPNAGYVRFECWGAGESFAWTQPFVVAPAKGAESKVNFIREWFVSDLSEGLAMSETRPVSPRDPGLVWTEAEAGGLKLPDGFLDTRNQSGGRDGIVYCWAPFKSPAAGQGQLFLGYDGPVRAWINGQQVFDGPGTNPATPDKLALNVTLRQGDNHLLVALSTNKGKAWGIFARCEPPK